MPPHQTLFNTGVMKPARIHHHFPKDVQEDEPCPPSPSFRRSASVNLHDGAFFSPTPDSPEAPKASPREVMEESSIRLSDRKRSSTSPSGPSMLYVTTFSNGKRNFRHLEDARPPSPPTKSKRKKVVMMVGSRGSGPESKLVASLFSSPSTTISPKISSRTIVRLSASPNVSDHANPNRAIDYFVQPAYTD
mmetsp:Transcript_19103/g.30382  ORF Transcript_19103/g.30382 Transcript_19103/m.30382 type:complete len:191 (+) Transcript_19103:65-637(+)